MTFANVTVHESLNLFDVAVYNQDNEAVLCATLDNVESAVALLEATELPSEAISYDFQ